MGVSTIPSNMKKYIKVYIHNIQIINDEINNSESKKVVNNQKRDHLLKSVLMIVLMKICN